MKMEHIGMQVEDPVAMCDWYCRHLGFQVKRRQSSIPFTIFLADAAGKMMLEIHRHDEVPLPIPDYRTMDPLMLHLALDVEDGSIEVETSRLIEAGATVAKDLVISAAGDKLLMLRDPWGISIQLVKRAIRMV